VPAPPRDKDATWQRTGAFCDKHGWSRARLLWELQNDRVRCRTIPPGRESEIDWHDPWVQERLDIENSQVTARDPEQAKTTWGRIVFVDVGAETLDIEVRLAAEATADAPRRPVDRWRKPPSVEAIEAAALAVAKNYTPDNPPTQADWWTKFNAQLGEKVARKVALGALGDYAPQLKRLRGQKPNRQS
jgi:hypothetical protein